MKLTVDIADSNTMLVEDVACKIGEAQGWTTVGISANEGRAAYRAPDGRVGEYDILKDEFVWQDKPDEPPYHFFASHVDEYYIDDSLAEFLDWTSACWGYDEGGFLVCFQA